MGVSASTVGNYRARAYEKLRVTGSLELRERFGAPEENPSESGSDFREVLLARGLSATEADVLSLVAAGLTSPQIASRLHVAPGTVSASRAHGYRLLGIHSKEGLAELLAESAPSRSPWPCRAFLLAHAAALVAAVAYVICYELVLRERAYLYYQGMSVWIFTNVAGVVLAFCGASLVGFIASCHASLKVRQPGWLALLGVSFVGVYAALFLVNLFSYDHTRFFILWFLANRTAYVVPMAIGCVSGFGWERLLRKGSL